MTDQPTATVQTSPTSSSTSFAPVATMLAAIAAAYVAFFGAVLTSVV